MTLSLIVPNAQQLAKSENKLLAKSLKWAKDLLEERDRLHRIAKMSGIETAGKWRCLSKARNTPDGFVFSA